MNVAVVITAWNPNSDWLDEAVASVAGEFTLIVDDGSDSPLKATERMGELVRIEHAGIGPASNYAIERIHGFPLISRLDADDRMMPGAISALRNYLMTHPDVDVVSGGMRYIAPNGRYIGDVHLQPMYASTKHRDRITHSGCMFRRDLWGRAGGYPAMRAADWHFWEACEKAGAKFTVLNQLVIERRIHPDSFSFKHSKHLQQWWEKAQRA